MGSIAALYPAFPVSLQLSLSNKGKMPQKTQSNKLKKGCCDGLTFLGDVLTIPVHFNTMTKLLEACLEIDKIKIAGCEIVVNGLKHAQTPVWSLNCV